MITLVIDTSTERGIIALFNQVDQLEFVELPFGLTSSKSLLPELEQLLKRHHFQVSDLSLIVCGTGPGSYTGIRVGAMVAKTLSYAAKIPLIGVCSLDGFTPNQEGSFAAVFDAKISGFYVKSGRNQRGHVTWDAEAQVVSIQDALPYLEDMNVIVTPHQEVIKRRIHNFDKLKWYECPPNPRSLLSAALESFHQGKYSLKGELEVAYLRKTQAELERAL